MKPPIFEYARPSTVDEAVSLLAGADGDAKILAGGQSLVPAMNFRLAVPSLLVDINRIADLAFVKVDGDVLRVGAMTRMRQVEQDPVIGRAVPILAAAATWVGHIQIRNRGTIGGSLAHADPAAEVPAVCLLVDAVLITRGPSGERRIPAAEFFQGALTTALAEDEILTEIRFPIPSRGERWGFREFAQRSGDFALAGAAVTIREADRAIDRSRAVVFGTATGPLRLPRAEALLQGRPLGVEAIGEAARVAVDETDLGEDSYDSALIEALVGRAMTDAAGR